MSRALKDRLDSIEREIGRMERKLQWCGEETMRRYRDLCWQAQRIRNRLGFDAS